MGLHAQSVFPKLPPYGAHMFRPFSVNISTSNLDAAVDWYVRVLSFKQFYRKTHPAMNLEIAFLKHGDFIIEIIQFDHSSEGLVYPDAPRHASVRGITHFSLLVENLKTELERLHELEVPTVWGPTTFEDLRMSVGFIRDLDRNLIKLVELA